MEELSKYSQSTGVTVRIYDLFGTIDSLWVCGYPLTRIRTKFLHYYTFVADPMIPLTIHVANSCKCPLVSAMVETGDCAEVCIRGGEWGAVTPDIPFNMTEFMFRVRENAVGTIGVSVAVRENMGASQCVC